MPRNKRMAAKKARRTARKKKQVPATEGMLRKRYGSSALCSSKNRPQLIEVKAKQLQKTTDVGWRTYSKYKNTKEIRYERFLCTPEFAAYLLQELNPHNRDISDSHARRLVELDENGSFVETGDVVKIAWDGLMTDGQHRLLLIVIRNKAMYVTICYGVDPETRKYCDETLKKRNAKDVAQIHGHELLPGMEPAARLILAYQAKAAGYLTLSNIGLVEKCIAMDRLEDLSKTVHACKKHSKLPTNSVLLAAAWIIYNAGNTYEDVVDFFQEVKAGTAPGDDPRWHLHNHLREQMGLGRGNQFANRIRCIKWCIYAWSQYCKGSSSTYLMWSSADGIKKDGTVKDPDCWPVIERLVREEDA